MKPNTALCLSAVCMHSLFAIDQEIFIISELEGINSFSKYEGNYLTRPVACYLLVAVE